MERRIPDTRWIWVPGWEKRDHGKTCQVLFRKAFTLSAVPAACRIRISAETRYKFWINGTLVSIGPSKGDRSVWYYDELEVAGFLQPGENVLAAAVLHYPPIAGKGNHSLFRTSTPGLYVEEILPGDPEPTEQGLQYLAGDPGSRQGMLGLSADASYHCHVLAGYSTVSENPVFAPLQFMEEVQGEAAVLGFENPGYDDSGWDSALPYPASVMRNAVVPGNLLKRTIPFPYRTKRQLESVVTIRGGSLPASEWQGLIDGTGSVTIPAGSRVSVEFSAGEEISGFLSLRMAGGKGSVIKILCAESYAQKDKDQSKHGGTMQLPVKTDRCDFVTGELTGYTDVFHPAGCGTLDAPERYEPYWLRTFRFIRLEAEAKEDLVLTGFDYVESGYPLEAKTSVRTSDDTLGPVWDISLRTLRRCMQETYMDCPFYEQLQYAMDSRSQILYTYMVSADDRLARKCIDDFSRSQRYDGMINCSYPCYEPNIIPGFAIYYILMIYDHMMYFGDRAFLRRYMACIDRILSFFDERLDERGLVGKVGGINGQDRYWSFIDWTTQWNETSGVPRATLSGPITMESLLYALGLTAAADIAGFLGRNDTAAEYLRRRAAVMEAVKRYCRDEKTGMIQDGPGVPEYSQHCQVFAVLTGLVTPEEGRQLLLETLDHPADYAQCSVAMAFYLFRAMEKTGLYERTSERWELWREMVRNHLTTCVEDGVTGRSDCHAWGSLALFELPAKALGVGPAAPGYKAVRIAPLPGYMTWAEGEVITPKGMVSVRWKKGDDGALQLEYKVPEGVQVVTEPGK